MKFLTCEKAPVVRVWQGWHGWHAVFRGVSGDTSFVALRPANDWEAILKRCMQVEQIVSGVRTAIGR